MEFIKAVARMRSYVPCTMQVAARGRVGVSLAGLQQADASRTPLVFKRNADWINKEACHARAWLRRGVQKCGNVQGDDYILYCHPSRQKTPRSDRLREWYLTLLRTAKAEGTVAHLSNLFDTFFEGGRDHRIERASITHMPYFEGAPR